MRDDRRCPSPEELAALAEGRLDERRREEVEAHLEGCRDCFEVLVGAARFQLEEGPAEVSAPMVRFPARRWPRYAAALAAAAALLLAVAVLLRQSGNKPASSVPELSRTTPAAKPPEAPEPPARRSDPVPAEAPAPPTFYAAQLERLTDGPAGAPALGETESLAGGAYSFSGTVSGDRLYLRLGARLLDLAVARRAGNAEGAGALEIEVGRLAAAAGWSGAPADPAALARQLPARLPAEAESLCRLGYWAEGGRLAAKFRRPGYYDVGTAQAFGPALQQAHLPPGAAAALDRILRRLGAGLSDATDWDRLERDFTDLVLMF